MPNIDNIDKSNIESEEAYVNRKFDEWWNKGRLEWCEEKKINPDNVPEEIISQVKLLLRRGYRVIKSSEQTREEISEGLKGIMMAHKNKTNRPDLN